MKEEEDCLLLIWLGHKQQTINNKQQTIINKQ